MTTKGDVIYDSGRGEANRSLLSLLKISLSRNNHTEAQFALRPLVLLRRLCIIKSPRAR